MRLKLWLLSLALFLLSSLVMSVQAETDQEAKIAQVINAFRDINKMPEKNIPPTLLRSAYGIAVIPSVVKVGFVVGGRYGKGIISVRGESGRWSNPVFVSVTGGSIGWQIGAQSTDVILVFKSKQSIDGIIKGKFTLGVDAAVAAGPVGRMASAATDTALTAEIYSYSRNRGLFAGVALDGAALQIENQDNVKYYKHLGLTARSILAEKTHTMPESANRLKNLLTDFAGKVQ